MTDVIALAPSWCDDPRAEGNLPTMRTVSGVVLCLSQIACSSSPPSALAQPDASTDSAPDAEADTDATLLAPAGDVAQSGAVDGITCDSTEQTLFHIHAHLAVYVHGESRLVPAGVGIAPPLQIVNGFVERGSCLAWLHTHDETGVIHIESPVQRTFTLGNFFDVWGQPLTPTRVGPAQGPVTAYVNGQPFASAPATIPLDAHAVIQLDVGAPVVAPQPYAFPPGL